MAFVSSFLGCQISPAGEASSALTFGEGRYDAFGNPVVIQITESSVFDSEPDVSGSNVVWWGVDGELYFWDGQFPIVNHTAQVTNNSPASEGVVISGSNVSWHASDGSDEEIYMTTVPEPSFLLLMASGLLGLAGLNRRRKSKGI